jgi:serine protease
VTPNRIGLVLVLAVPALLVSAPSASPRLLDTDTSPPVLQGLSVSPSSVDVTGGSSAVTVTATITDDLSGVVEGVTQLGIESPSRNQISGGPLSRVSADTYKATLTIPQNAEGGAWHLRYVTLRDNAGNSRSMFEAELGAAGFAVSVQVTSVADTAPPSLSTLTLSPAAVDVTAGPATVMVSATITDDLSGVVDGQTQMGIESQPDAQIVATALTRSSGSSYVGQLTIPQNAASGTWRLRYVTLVDQAGNRRSMFRDELAAAGFGASVTVASAQADSTPPALGSLTITPTSIDVGNGPATITATATITDDISGVAESCGCAGHQIAFEQSSTGQVAISTFTRAAGNTWTAAVTIPQSAGTGTWRLRLISLRDNAGNSRTYFAADLAAMGLAPQIAVTATGVAPPASAPYTGTPTTSPAPSVSGTAGVQAGTAGQLTVPSSATTAPQSTVSWTAATFGRDVTVRAATAAVGHVASGTLFAGSYGIEVTVTRATPSNTPAESVTAFDAPLDVAFTGVDLGVQPAYSRDDVSWTEIPRLTGNTLPASQPDGYYWDGTTLHVLTRHATVFGLFRTLTGAVKTSVRPGSAFAKVVITASAPSKATITIKSAGRLLGSWAGQVTTRKTLTIHLSRSLKRGMPVTTTLTLAHGRNRLRTGISSSVH